MKKNYERWMLSRLSERPRCNVEPTMTCIPLRGDPICMACFETELTEGTEDGDDNP